MLALPFHLGLLGAGLVLVALAQSDSSLPELLPLWALPPLLLLVPLGRLLRRRLAGSPRLAARAGPGGRLGRVLAGSLRGLAALLTWVTPLLVLAAVLFLSPYPDRLGGLFGEPVPGWTDLTWLPLLAPLLPAHLWLAAEAHRRSPLHWRTLLPPRGLDVRWALFAWSNLVLVLALMGLVSRSRDLRVLVEESSLAGLGLTALLVAVLMVLVPRLLLAHLDTIPPPPLFRRLAESPRFGGVRFRLLEWRTDDAIANAMVLAMPLGARPVLFTDAFLGRLSVGEFEAVLAHELGHVRGRHVGLLGAWVLGAALAFDLGSVALLSPADLDGTLGVALAVAFLLLVWAGVGYLSRRLELEADLFALEATGDGTHLARALLRSGQRSRRRPGWRHFSIQRRIDFLRAAARDPGVGQRLRASLRPLRLGGYLLLALALGGTALRHLGEADREAVWIQLRRGQLERAAELYAGLEPSRRAEVWAPSPDVEYYGDLLSFGAERERARGGSPLDLVALGEEALDQGLSPELVRLLDLVALMTRSADPGLAQLRADVVGLGTGATTQLDTSLPLPSPWGEVRAGLVGRD